MITKIASFFFFPVSNLDRRKARNWNSPFCGQKARLGIHRFEGFEPSLARLRASSYGSAAFYERFCVPIDRLLSIQDASNSPRLPDILNLGIMPHIHNSRLRRSLWCMYTYSPRFPTHCMPISHFAPPPLKIHWIFLERTYPCGVPVGR